MPRTGRKPVWCASAANLDGQASLHGREGLQVKLNVQECFTGEVTGSTNITALLEWVKTTDREPEKVAFQNWNARDLLEAHEFDRTFKRRIKSLTEKIIKDKTVEPLLCVKIEDGSVYVIDGWHRLQIIYLSCTAKQMNIVPFLAYMVTLEEAKRFPVPKDHVILETAI